jgi:hypothetical protein
MVRQEWKNRTLLRVNYLSYRFSFAQLGFFANVEILEIARSMFPKNVENL